jgi:hypothetical protein
MDIVEKSSNSEGLLQLIRHLKNLYLHLVGLYLTENKVKLSLSLRVP